MTREELIAALRGFSTPELSDGMGLCRTMDCRIQHQVGKKRIVGTAVTVDVPSASPSTTAICGCISVGNPG